MCEQVNDVFGSKREKKKTLWLSNVDIIKSLTIAFYNENYIWRTSGGERPESGPCPDGKIKDAFRRQEKKKETLLLTQSGNEVPYLQLTSARSEDCSVLARSLHVRRCVRT